MTTQILRARARACIADSEREENSLATRVDAAIQAIAFLDQASLEDAKIQVYLSLKSERPLDEFDLLGYHAYALSLAKKLLSAYEHSTIVAPESAVQLLYALRGSSPEFINLFGSACSQEDAAAVLTAADPLKAARDLMTRKLNESERK